MDIRILTADIPDGGDWRALPGWQKKQQLATLLRRMHDAVAAEDREPDGWEAGDFAAALGFGLAGLYTAAIAYAARAATPLAERSDMVPWGNAVMTLQDFDHALREFEGMPAIERN